SHAQVSRGVFDVVRCRLEPLTAPALERGVEVLEVFDCFLPRTSDRTLEVLVAAKDPGEGVHHVIEGALWTLPSLVERLNALHKGLARLEHAFLVTAR